MYKVKMDGEYLYHPWDMSRTISSGQLTLELGKNGTFDCDIPIENPLYNAMRQRRSIVEVIRYRTESGHICDEECIYRGVYINDADGMNMQREAETDGDMVFLNDSYQRPHNRTTTPQEEFTLIISGHNAQVDVTKRFSIGVVEISGAAVARNVTGYQSTKDAIEELLETYGGYVITRCTDGNVYIDWLSEFSHQSGQDIRYGKNVIDITKYLKAEDLATRVIPLGKNNNGIPTTISSVNNGLDYLQDESAIEQFGIIEKTVEFPDIEDPQELKKAGMDWLNSNKGVVLTIEVTAADLAEIDINIEYLNVGDWVRCVARQYGIDAVMQITKMSLNILKISNSKITLGSTMQTFTQRQGGVLPAISRAVLISQSASLAAETASQTAQEAMDAASNGLAAYPINSIYLSVSPTNPTNFFGGTWVRWGVGKLIAGVDFSQTEFNVVEKTGGEKTHVLSTGEMPSHNHTVNGGACTTSQNGNHTHNIYFRHGAESGNGGKIGTSTNNDGAWDSATYSGNHTHSVPAHTHNVSSVGSGQAHNNLPPYVTCYMWKRIA